MPGKIAYPLMLLDDTSAVTFYDDAESLCRAIEAPDVRNGIYTVFDVTGRLGWLSVAKPPGSMCERIYLDLGLGRPMRASDLRSALNRHIQMMAGVPDRYGAIARSITRARDILRELGDASPGRPDDL